jgi:exosortase
MWKNISLHLTENNIVLAAKVSSVVAATIILFSRDLTVIFTDALQSETTSYMLFIPLLFAYFVYRKRKMLRATVQLERQDQPTKTRHLSAAAGILLSTTAVLIYWQSTYTFSPLEYHMLTLPLFVAGLVLIIFNPQTLRQLVFPTFFLVFLTPPTFDALYAIGSSLSVISSEASNTIVRAFGVTSTIVYEFGTPTIVITRPDGTTRNFLVDIACSGIYSLIGFLIFVLFVAYVVRDRPWKRLTLIAIGIPLMYLLNIIRITIILLIGNSYGEETALQVFHMFGGWVLIFLGTLLLLIVSEKALHTQIFTRTEQKCPTCTAELPTNQDFCHACGRIRKPKPIKIHKKDLIKIATILVAAILLVLIQAPTFALTRGPPQVIVDTLTGTQGSTEILPSITGYDLLFAYRDTTYETIASQEMALVYVYAPQDPNQDPVDVTIGITSSPSSLHKWDACLTAAATTITSKDIQLTQNPPIIARFYAFRYEETEDTQAVLYWVESAIFNVNNTSQQKLAIITVRVPMEASANLIEVEKQLREIAARIAEYWAPIKLWSQIILIISKDGAYLAASTGAMLAAVTLFWLTEKIKEQRANAKAYDKLSEPDKQIVDIVRETEKKMKPTLDKIAMAYKEKTCQTTDKTQLLETLSAIEKTGIIETTIIGKQDEPVLIWKTQMSPKKVVKA